MIGGGELSADEVIELLDLAPLPAEGGWFRRTHVDEHAGAIYFLITPEAFSAMHVLTVTEAWHFHAGAPVSMLLLDSDGSVRETVLGTDLRAGERPQLVVPAGVRQGASTTGAWSLVGTTTAPPYDDDCFTLCSAESLIESWPSATGRIRELTRP